MYDLLKSYYDFLETVLGMDSFDDRGASMRSIVSVRFDAARAELPQCIGNGFNAAWVEPERIAIFPPAISEFPEVFGHEFGHALITSGSRLLYRDQSGALHESIADAIGVTFRAWVETGGRFEPEMPVDIWKLRSSAGVIRDMQNPRRSGDLPNHYSDYRFLYNEDNGGVHVNSSILNQGFYLLALGGQHPDYPRGPEVPGIGIAKAVNIFGRAGFNLLTPNANFRDARYAFALVAEILYGPASLEWIATHTAMDAIGIPGGWDVPTQPTGTTPSSTLEDDEGPSTAGTEPDDATDQPPPAPTRKTDEAAPPPDIDTSAPTTPRSPRRELSWLPALVLVPAVLFLLWALLKARSRLRPPQDADTDQMSMSGIENPEASVVATPSPNSPWSLRSPDGAETIPLMRSVLESSEGLVIGRAMELCHIQIQDVRVSRRHVRCRQAGGVLLIEDLNSTAGTRVGHIQARPFVPIELPPGETLHIAEHKFHLAPTAKPGKA